MIEISHTRYKKLLDHIKEMVVVTEAVPDIETDWYKNKLEELELLIEERSQLHDRLSNLLATMNDEYKVVKKRMVRDFRELRKLEALKEQGVHRKNGQAHRP